MHGRLRGLSSRPLVLDHYAAECSRAGYDQLLYALAGTEARRNRLVAVAAECSDSTHLNIPVRGDLDVTSPEGRGDVNNRFVSALSQNVEDVQLLPIPEGELAGLDAQERAQEGSMLFEPDAEEMIAELLVSSLEVNVYRALLESTASEHGARMTAMRSASENAGEVIEDLTLEMNRARQAEITQEIMEVVGGAEALQ